MLQCVAVLLQCRCSVLQCDAILLFWQIVGAHAVLLQCAAVCYNVLQCVDVCCSELQSVAECCSVLQCVAVCCSVLRCIAVCCTSACPANLEHTVLLQCCCSVLQCVAVCCSSTCPANGWSTRSAGSDSSHDVDMRASPATCVAVDSCVCIRFIKHVISQLFLWFSIVN